MAATQPSKHKKPLPPKPRPNVNENMRITKCKPSKPKKRTPPISPSLSQSSSICKRQKPPPISTPKKTKKAVPPPPVNRTQSQSLTIINTTNPPNKYRNIKPPPPLPPPLTNKRNITNKNKLICKPPKKRKHQKAHSVNSLDIIKGIPISPIKPICNHPTIGEFYSARVHKKKLLQRQLPSKPENVNVYFILMGKIYKYIINICLQHKMSQLLPKLSSKLVGNDQILQVITNELGRNERSLSAISKNDTELDIKTYDQIIKDPIFIYKNNTYNSSFTFIQIGYKKDLLTQNIPYIIIVSCLGYDMNDNTRYNNIKTCVEHLGYESLDVGNTKEELINYVHTFIKTNIVKRKRSRSCTRLNGLNKHKKKENTLQKRHSMKLPKRHSMKLSKRHNQSANNLNDLNNNNMIRLDLSQTNPTKLEFNSPNILDNNMESKFNQLFRKSVSDKNKTIQSPKPRKYREKKEPTPISRRSSKYKNKNSNSNVMKAGIIVQGYLSTNIGGKMGKKWKKYYYTFSRDRILCSYLTKDCDLSLPIDRLSLVRGKCSFNIHNIESKSLQTITITIQTSTKPMVKCFRGSIASLEKWKRAFLF